MRINSWNEWDPLKAMIVGRADGARVPRRDTSLLALNYADQLNKSDFIVHEGLYPQQVIDEANEDLDRLCSELSKLGIEVYRPEDFDTALEVSNGQWRTEGYYTYCPRDSVLVHGHNIIESPMPSRSRYHETLCFKELFISAFKDGANWISAPKPRLGEDTFDLTEIHPDKLTLTEMEPCFDAANVLRCGYDLFYLVSNSGNILGGQWLQRVLGPQFRVHFLENVYSYMHLDSTISLLRPGLVLLNPSRMNENNIPEALQGWDKIWCADPVDIGYYGDYCHASNWIGMNLIMVNPNLAIVEENQKPLIEQLEKHKIDVLPLPVRHQRTLGGGFHCVTLDLYREGQLEDYRN